MAGNPSPTLQDIADHTGFSRSTISLALRDHPSLPEPTRRRIQQAARELGYRTNPLVAALMTQLRRRQKTYRETLAVVSRMKGDSKISFYQILYKAMADAAFQLGYGINRFYLGDEKLSGPRLSKVLLSRGIHGIILFPGITGDVEYPALDWEHFASVLVGFDKNWAIFHQVVSNYTYDIDLALQIATRAGSQRIGFAIPADRDHTTDFSWSSRFLLYQQGLPRARRLPFPPPPQNPPEPRPFLAWMEKHRPDTLLVAGDAIPVWLQQAGIRIPQDVRVINLVQREEKGLAGVDPRTATVGRVAVELLVSLLQSNALGLPEFPRLIAVQGQWTPGPSFPEPSVGLRK